MQPTCITDMHYPMATSFMVTRAVGRISGVSSEDDRLVNVIRQSWRRSSSFIALSRLQIWQKGKHIQVSPIPVCLADKGLDKRQNITLLLVRVPQLCKKYFKSLGLAQCWVGKLWLLPFPCIPVHAALHTNAAIPTTLAAALWLWRYISTVTLDHFLLPDLFTLKYR